MSLFKKSLVVIMFLGLAGYGVHNLWADIEQFLVSSGKKNGVVAKKISPVKPDFSRLKSRQVSLTEKTFTFFETLGDSSMKKFVGLNGEILPKAVAPSKESFVEKKPVAVKGLFETAVAQNLPPLSPAAVTVPKQSRAVSNPDGNYAVQVSSFRKLERAEALMKKLREKGYDPFLTATKVPDKGVWHRVFIGAYSDENTAKAAARDAWKKERLNAMVVRKAG